MQLLSFDIAVIGGGAAGLCAAAAAAGMGKKTLVIERSERAGGVLLQCIHSGFGLHFFNEELTGPEYAERVLHAAENSGAEILLSSSVMKIKKCQERFELDVFSGIHGVLKISAAAVIFAAGCRERCRGNLGIPGVRTAGVFNAGFAQQLLNTEGYLPGRRAVIIGSGDIGLIMARRLAWSGVDVQCVVEIMPYPAGLSRNIAQCLEDFNIPLLLEHTVVSINGKERVRSITIAPHSNGIPQMEQAREILCDTLLFSVGLVPENELLLECGAKINPLTGGAIVDGRLMTSVPGVFACGNGLHVHDLVDFVSREAERCAGSAAAYCDGKTAAAAQIAVVPGDGVRYVIPNFISGNQENTFYLRSSRVLDKAVLKIVSGAGKVLMNKELRYVKPAEMLSAVLPAGAAGNDVSRIGIFLEECK